MVTYMQIPLNDISLYRGYWVVQFMRIISPLGTHLPSSDQKFQGNLTSSDIQILPK